VSENSVAKSVAETPSAGWIALTWSASAGSATAPPARSVTRSGSGAIQVVVGLRKTRA